MTMSNRSVAFVLAGLILGGLLAALDSTVASTALPTIIGDLGGLGQISWISTTYLLAAAAVVPIVGKLADMYGRKRWYLLGLVLFMGGSALCGLAQNMTQLILFRGLQGLGGGMLTPVAQTLAGDLFPGEKRVKIQGLLAGLFALASILGPKLGGFIVEHWDWRWVFYVNLPLGLLAFLMIWRSLTESIGTTARSIDYTGAASITIATVALLLGLDLGGDKYAWGSWQIIGLFATAAVSLIVCILAERRAEDPVLPLALYRDRVFAVCNSLSFIVGAGMTGSLIFIPLFMQGVVGTSANQAGSVLTPMMLSVVVGSIVGSRLLLKVTYRAQLLTGGLITAGGYYLLSTMTPDTSTGMVQLFMAVTGLGLGFIMPTLTLAVQNHFPAERRGVVTASVNFARSVGSSLGVTVFGILMNNRATGLLKEGLEGLTASLPAGAERLLAPMQQAAVTDPMSVFGLLLRPDMAAKLPAAIRDALFSNLQHALAQSLQFVFLCSLALAAVALVIMALIGSARMPRSAKGKGEAASTVTAAD